MPRPPALTRSTAVTEDGVRSAGGAATTLQPTWVEDAPACERTLARGTRVGRYSVVRWVGAGAMGEVYAAEDPELSRPVALKLMRYRVRQRKPDWVGRARLRREAQALARLSHPNVVPVYDVGVFDDRCFVAMELVHGQTLRRWARARPRTWREVVRVMIDAGRGLAAAHLAGMVHRDFKPDNVLIDDEDRVRVMDFGLARGTDDDDDDDPCSLSLADGLVTTLTKTGAVMGTPGYMSPEQHAGHRVDARGDQYSFCVALFELLYGFRPFAGPTVGDLARQKWVGHVRRMGSGGTSNTERDVPRWLRKIVARGLAPHPEERWSSMSALLGALRRGTRPSRYLSWLAASGIGMAVAGLSAAFASPSSPCDGGTQRVAEVWDQQRKHELRDAFDSTGRRYAADTYSAVERWVDDYADAWEGLHANTCHSAYERHELTAREHDRRMACLDRGLQRLDALIDVLTVGDATVLDRSVSAAAALGHPSECRTQRLGVPPPRDPAIAAQHHAVRAQLARAEAHDQAGDYERGLRVATVGLNDALATNDPLLEAEARLRRGHLLQRVRNLTEAERELSQAVWLAEGQGDDRVAAEAATHLVWLVGDLLDRTQDGLAWARHARSLLARTGNEPIPRAQLLEAEANVLVEDAEHDEALSKLERAIALREAHQGARHPGLAMAYNNFGSALTSAGRPEEALAQQRRALSIQRVALGPDHPHVGITMTNIGAHLVRFGRYAEARTELQRAREIFEHSVGVDHPLTAHALNAMAGCAVREFGFERGRALFEQVVDIRERALHPRHLQVADALANLGGVLTDLDRNDEARTVLRRALSILEEHRGTEHPDLGGALLNLADAERHSGNIERAERLVGRATALWEEHFGPDHPELIYALRVTGEIHMERGRTQAAIEVVERARALDSKARQDPAFRAELDFLLARALWNADRDPIRARILAQDAMEVLQGFESFPASRREPIGRWLAEREAEQGDEHPGRRPRVADARALPTAGGTDRASAGPGPRRPGPR